MDYFSVTISRKLEILPENTEKSVKLQKVKLMPKITENIVIVVLLLNDGDDMESNLGIMNVKYKGTIMFFIMSEKYLHASRIQYKTGITATIYEVNDDKKLNNT